MRATEPARAMPAQSAVASRRGAGRRLMVGCAARQLPASLGNEYCCAVVSRTQYS